MIVRQGASALDRSQRAKRLRAWRRFGWWREAQTWRLASGLVLFAFVLTHYLNHALGLVSLDAMEEAQAARFAV